MYAPTLGYIWVGQRLYTGLNGLVCSRREDAMQWGKALLQSYICIDCSSVPTYCIVSSEDYTEC